MSLPTYIDADGWTTRAPRENGRYRWRPMGRADHEVLLHVGVRDRYPVIALLVRDDGSLSEPIPMLSWAGLWREEPA